MARREGIISNTLTEIRNLWTLISIFKPQIYELGENGVMTEGSNWVEHRYAIESSLERNSPQLWQDVRSALQNACESFVARYGNSKGVEINVKPENGRRLRITLFTTRGEVPRFVVVSFDPKVNEISWVNDDTGAIKISADQNGAFLADENGKHVTPDELSRQILEPFLFGKP
jgi:hypothetical protein